jgi:hypothetical protein
MCGIKKRDYGNTIARKVAKGRECCDVEGIGKDYVIKE